MTLGNSHLTGEAEDLQFLTRMKNKQMIPDGPEKSRLRIAGVRKPGV